MHAAHTPSIHGLGWHDSVTQRGLAHVVMPRNGSSDESPSLAAVQQTEKLVTDGEEAAAYESRRTENSPTEAGPRVAMRTYLSKGTENGKAGIGHHHFSKWEHKNNNDNCIN